MLSLPSLEFSRVAHPGNARRNSTRNRRFGKDQFFASEIPLDLSGVEGYHTFTVAFVWSLTINRLDVCPNF